MLEVSRWHRLALAIAKNAQARSLTIGLIAAQSLCANAEQAPTADPDYNPYLYLDWLPRSELTPEARAKLPAICSGTFVAPPPALSGSRPTTRRSPIARHR